MLVFTTYYRILNLSSSFQVKTINGSFLKHPLYLGHCSLDDATLVFLSHWMMAFINTDTHNAQ